MLKKQWVDFYKNKKVLVTGHTGFKGTWLSIWLAMLGARVIGVSNSCRSVDRSLSDLLDTYLMKTYDLDISKFHGIHKVFEDENPDIVFHMAAQAIVGVSVASPLQTWMANSVGTLNILESIRLSKKPCVAVCVTSDKVYKNNEWAWGYREIDELGGTDPYSSSKVSAEHIIASYIATYFSNGDEKRIGIGRAGNVIGGADWSVGRIVPDCVRAWNNERPVSIKNPFSTRPWQHVLEPLSGYLDIGSSIANNFSLQGEAFNFGPDAAQEYSVENLVSELGKHFRFSEYNILSDEGDVVEQILLKLANDKAARILNWYPRMGFELTIQKTAEWYQLARNGEANQVINLMLSQIREF